MPCAIWYHLYDLKNVRNTHGGVLILVKLQASGFNCRNGTKSRNEPHLLSVNSKTEERYFLTMYITISNHKVCIIFSFFVIGAIVI